MKKDLEQVAQDYAKRVVECNPNAKDAEGLIATAVVYGANELYKKIDEMDFGNAIKALKLGKAIRRKGWNGKGLFVVKQVPAHIESDIIPKMQSLPQSAKDLILAGKGFVDYTSQCLIYNENNGRADSWVPSISDVFAEDWEVVEIAK